MGNVNNFQNGDNFWQEVSQGKQQEIPLKPEHNTPLIHDKFVPPLVKQGDGATLALWVGCYATWGIGLFVVPQFSLVLAGIVVLLALVLQSSLSHEILHGHPFTNKQMNTALGLFAIGLFVPYIRFRDTHLAHHIDERLTDPYDDPESNFCDPALWAQKTEWVKTVLRFNNTMFGRMLIGPLLSQWAFMTGDARATLCGDRQIGVAWLLHVPAVVVTLICVATSAMPVWLYFVLAYCAMSILKIRTFLEHRVEADPTARTVIVEMRCPLALLFLNNSLHVVHHMHPKVPWYALPALYRDNKAVYQDCNGGYVYRSYAQIFRQYFWRAKDPVPHPRWPLD